MAELHVERLRGEELQEHLPALAHLRTRVFREFPYLYEGDEAYERRYLQKYVDSAESVMVLVRDGGTIVGASSGLPLADEVAELKRPFEVHGYDLERVFYCGESVLLPEYRGRGLGVRFFEEREGHAQSLGRFDLITFCAVQRPAYHPRRPADYVPLDRFWTRRGYVKHPELHTQYMWQDLDETSESPKPMVFWLKSLEKR